MINISYNQLLIAILLIAAIIAVIYLIALLRKLQKTVDTLDSLMQETQATIKETQVIAKDAQVIVKDAQVIVADAKDGTEGIKAAVIKVGNATSDMANIVHGNRSTFKAATNVVNAMSGLIGLFKK